MQIALRLLKAAANVGAASSAVDGPELRCAAVDAVSSTLRQVDASAEMVSVSVHLALLGALSASKCKGAAEVESLAEYLLTAEVFREMVAPLQAGGTR